MHSNVPNDPPLHVLETPALFNKWISWVRGYKDPGEGYIRPMGERVGPIWCRWEFDGLESFYEYYRDLLEHSEEL